MEKITELKSKCFDLIMERDRAQVFINNIQEEIKKVAIEIDSLTKQALIEEKEKDGI